MQELLEWHRLSMRSYSETNKMIEVLLEKEKEQIIEAFKSARNIQDSDEISITFDWVDSKEYYNQIYNQKEETLEDWKSKFTHHCAIKDNQNK